MKKYICECCGGAIDPKTMKCEYCGTQYKIESDALPPIRIETYRNPVETLTTQIEISDEQMANITRCGGDIVNGQNEMLVKEIARSLGNAMIPYISFDHEYNLAYCKHKVRGTIKIVKPVRRD